MMSPTRKALSIGLACAFVVIGVLAVAGWALLSDKLIISTSTQGVKIQTVFLGEYCTPVSKLVISEADSGLQVVKMVAKSGESRMHTISLHKGTNQFQDMYLDGYSISFLQGTPYVFKADCSYKVVARWKYLSSERSFTLP